MDLLRFATAGSVDDGKSTLIGRLLYESKAIFDDQLEAIERTSDAKGFDYTDLALLTDGLRAEREQGITIDVAYRYFATPRRKFIIADTPGHVQYTRNMVTGASTANLALLLVDARKGVLEQTRRHAVIGSILGVHHFALCVNKMDLVDFSEARFNEVTEEFAEFASKLEVPDITFIPISALAGDNVTQHSPNLSWYGGPTLLHHLEHVYVGADRNLIDPRFPVQYVIRPQTAEHRDYRGYAGTVASGAFRVGDEVLVLPSGLTSTISGIDGPRGEMEEALPNQSVVLRLADDLDISRGDMICRPNNAAEQVQDVDATICWFSSKPLTEGTELVLKHTTRTMRCRVQEIRYRLEVNELHRDASTAELRLNDIGRVSIRATSPLFSDSYRRNRTTGSFVLIDPGTHATVAGGIVLG